MMQTKPTERFAKFNFNEGGRMTPNFKIAHDFTAKWEGGLSEHKNDPGGITNYGVSLRFLMQLAQDVEQEFKKTASTCDGSNTFDNPYDFNDDGAITAEDIRECTKVQAAKLMHENFWKPLHSDSLPLAIATALYDGSVNMGVPRSVRILQETCNIVGEAHLDVFTPIAEDGICGPKTITLCATLKEFGLDFYVARMAVRQRINFYVNLSRNNDNFAVFLNGWKNRCQNLLEYLAQLERDN